MKEIYKAKKNEVIKLTITNSVEVESTVYLNGVEYDNVLLDSGKDNTRVLEVALNDGDVISVKENDLINYLCN
jgi:hypothetical protein